MKLSGIISLLLCAAVSVTALAGCSGNKALAGTVNTGKYSSDLSGEYLESGKVCENDRFELYWDNTKKYVWFKEKATQTVYSTIADGAMTPVYDEDGILKKNNPLAESPILVYYLDSKTISEKYLNVAVNVLEEGETYTESIENGLRVTYDFAEAEISVPVEYTLNEDSFKATVITKDIKDNGENYVTAVALSPFFCSVKNDTENSYLFLPDGSGTLLGTATTDLIGTQGSMSVYGTDPTVQSYHLEAYKKQVSMPVFGVKNGSKALFGIITSGAAGAELAWNVGSQNVGFSAVYAFFRIRGYNLIHAPEGFTTTQVELQAFDDRINTEPLSVSYYPLTGNNADYNGMARLYRNYLTENKLLSKTEKTMPAVSIKLLGGVFMKKYIFGIPRTVLYTLTSVNDAAEITEYFSKELDGNILVNLVGFGETGLDFGKVLDGLNLPSGIETVLSKALSQIFMLVWQSGIQTILIIAGLQSIPDLLYEVAKVEGATKWEVFWFVTLPMMLRTMMLVIIFTVIELVSSGTNTVVAKGYAQFGAMEYGVGSAMLLFYFMVVGLFLVLFFFVYNRVFVKKWG